MDLDLLRQQLEAIRYFTEQALTVLGGLTTPPCLHPPERRHFLPGSTMGAPARVRCLDCEQIFLQPASPAGA
jgi:hypothetical protein